MTDEELENALATCPKCGGEWVSQARCILRRRRCRNGHEWESGMAARERLRKKMENADA